MPDCSDRRCVDNAPGGGDDRDLRFTGSIKATPGMEGGYRRPSSGGSPAGSLVGNAGLRESPSVAGIGG